MASHIIVIDAGTTGIRAVVVDQKLNHVHSVYERIPDRFIETPQQGWVTQDPAGIWETTRYVVTRAIQFIGLENIRGIALTTQRSSVVLTDRNGVPVTPFIPWQDSRTSELCDSVNKSASLGAVRGGSTFLHFVSRSAKFKAGSVWTFAPVMACTKVAWLFRNDQRLSKMAAEGSLFYGGLDSWILFNLVGTWETDRSNLSAAGFYDPWTDGPSGLVFNLLDLPQNLFTRCDRPSAGQWGNTAKDLFGAELPVLAVVSDQGAAVMGECCFEPGDAKITLGSGAFFSCTTGSARKGHRGGSEVQYPAEGVYPLVAYEIGEEATYVVEGSEPACGTGLDWVQRAFGLWQDVQETSALAASVPDTQGVTFVPSLFGLRAPHNQNRCKGGFIGLTTAATRAHLVRAVLEGVCWRMYELLHCINSGVTRVQRIRVDGGVSRNNFVCQFLADICGIKIHRGKNIEATVTGCAMLAGITAGWFEWTKDGKNTMRSMTQGDDEVFTGNMSTEEREKRFLLWLDACDRIKLE